LSTCLLISVAFDGGAGFISRGFEPGALEVLVEVGQLLVGIHVRFVPCSIVQAMLGGAPVEEAAVKAIAGDGTLACDDHEQHGCTVGWEA